MKRSTESANDLPREGSTHWWIFGLLATLIFMLVVAWGFAVALFKIGGTFGDAFGVVNALFSGLAFAGIIHAILLQRRELELQRKELELTRLELARAALAQERSEQAIRAETESQTRPYLKVMLHMGGFRESLSITNEGRTPAVDVQLSVKPEVYRSTFGGNPKVEPISKLPIFMIGGMTLVPRMALSYDIGSQAEVSEASGGNGHQPDEFQVTASYRSRSGVEFKEVTFLSSSLIQGTSPYKQRTELESLARGVEDVRRAVEKVAGSVSAIANKIRR